MCSPRLSELANPEALHVLRGAVTDVAERTFFASAEPFAADRLAELRPHGEAWLAATVPFDRAGCAGTVACALPHDLARVLFDACSGRDPQAPQPCVEQLFDLVGEFTNMVCGAWLTRTIDGPAFVLGRPQVQVAAGPPALDAYGDLRLVMAPNDLPLIVAITSA